MGENPAPHLSETSLCVMVNIYSRVLPPMEPSAPAYDFDKFSLISEAIRNFRWHQEIWDFILVLSLAGYKTSGKSLLLLYNSFFPVV